MAPSSRSRFMLLDTHFLALCWTLIHHWGCCVLWQRISNINYSGHVNIVQYLYGERIVSSDFMLLLLSRLTDPLMRHSPEILFPTDRSHLSFKFVCIQSDIHLYIYSICWKRQISLFIYLIGTFSSIRKTWRQRFRSSPCSCHVRGVFVLLQRHKQRNKKYCTDVHLSFICISFAQTTIKTILW